MEVLSLSVTFTKSQTFPSFRPKNTTQIHQLPIKTKLPNKNNHSSSCSISCSSSFTRISATSNQTSIPQTDMLLFPNGNSKHWVVRMDKPAVGVVTKAQIVDHYAQILTKIMGNEKDAQMCIYHVSWKTNFGFCCELDEDCAHELSGVPGVLSVQPDDNFESENKDYEGRNLENSLNMPNSSEASQEASVKTKKLFVTGLSFYTSEKTLRAAFEALVSLLKLKLL
uniref:MORF/ORRM1/DAG-like MORF domain-containing protein n=1 Tax=Medicago truncatula TaxID=3880 RepID=I3S0A3_MEDTR|nr:unknown [Medicago truncatula]